MPKFPKEILHQHNNDIYNYSCDFDNCNREFNSKRNLVDHCRGHHEGKKPHLCTYPGCGKSFLRPAHLLIHNRIHTGEKPFICEFEGCGKRWNQKSALKQHIRSHTGEKPFKCTYNDCNKKFSTSSSCKRHVSTHFAVTNNNENNSYNSSPKSSNNSNSNGELPSVSSPSSLSPSFVQYWSVPFSIDSPTHSSSSSDEEIDTALLSNFKHSIARERDINNNTNNINNSNNNNYSLPTPKMNVDFLLN